MTSAAPFPTWASVLASASNPLRRVVDAVPEATVTAAFEAFIARPQYASQDGAFPDDDGHCWPHLPSDTQGILETLSRKEAQHRSSCDSQNGGSAGDYPPTPTTLSKSGITAAAEDAALLEVHCRHPSGNLLPLLIPHAVVSRDVARYLSHRLPARAMDGPDIDTSPWLDALDLRLLRKQFALTLPPGAEGMAIFKVVLPHLPELRVVDAAVSYDCREVAKRLAEALHQAPPSLGVCIIGDLSLGTVSQFEPIGDRIVSLDVEDCTINEGDTFFLESLPRLLAVRAGTIATSGGPLNRGPRRAQPIMSASIDQHYEFLMELPCLLSLSVKPSAGHRVRYEGEPTLPMVLRSAHFLTRLELSTMSVDDDLIQSLFTLRHLRQLTLRSVHFNTHFLQGSGPGDSITGRELAAGFASLEVLELVRCGNAPALIAAIPSLPKLQAFCIACSGNPASLLVFDSNDSSRPVFPALTSLDLCRQSITDNSQWEDVLAIPTLAELRCSAFCDQLPLLDRGAWETAWVAQHPGRRIPECSAHASLRRLHLGNSDEGMLDHVACLPQLEELDVAGSANLTPRSFFALEDMLSLRILNVSDTQFDSVGFEAAASLPQLWSLNMSDTNVDLTVFLQTMEGSEGDDRAMPYPSLRVLVVEGMPDDDAIEEWAAENRPNLTVVV